MNENKKNRLNIITLRSLFHKYKEIFIWLGGFLWVLILITIATKGFNPNKTPYNENFIKIKSFEIRWYAVFILSGISIAAIMAYHEFSRFNINKEKLTNALLVIVPISILFSRLYYVIFDPDKSKYTDFISVIAIWEGGLAIHGAIIGAFISVIIWSIITKVNLFQILDLVVIGFLIGQIVGRWGNFMNQEAYGHAITQSHPIYSILAPFIKSQMTKGGNLYLPTYLIEGFFNFLALTAFVIYRRFRILKIGDTFLLYLIYYGTLRGLLIEPFRTDPLYIGKIKVNEWPQFGVLVSLAIIVFIIRLIYENVTKKNIPYYYDVSNFNLTSNIETARIDTIIFDFDNTLVDSYDIIVKSFKYAFKEILNKEDLTKEEIDEFIGPTLYESFSKYTMDSDTIDKLIYAYREHNLKLNTKQNLKLKKFARLTLLKLHLSGYRLGIISSKKTSFVKLGLKVHNIEKYFDFVVGNDIVSKHKPDPESIDYVINEYKIKRDKIIYIGDHYNDIKFAHNANIVSVLLKDTMHLDKAISEKPNYIISNLYEINEILRRLNYV